MVARSNKTDEKVYKSIDDRDAALDATYDLSGPMRALLGPRPGTMLALVYEHLAEIAALFLTEDRRHEHVESLFERWQQRHFGRVLEFTARRLLHQEIWRQIDPREGGTIRPSGSLYASRGDQQRWEDAESKTRPLKAGESHLARLEGICRRAGAPIGAGVVRSMPDAEAPRLSPDAEFERLQYLRRQAVELSTPRAPYREPGADDE